MPKPVRVLSLFGGHECGMQALNIANIPVASYHSSEIDEYAIKIAADNFPNVVHIGSVTGVTVCDGAGPDGAFKCLQNVETVVDGKFASWEIPGGFDLLFAGPPCQDLSISGKRLGLVSETFEEYLGNLEKVKNGEPVIHPVTGQVVEKFRSELFWEFYRVLHEAKPRFFMMENVESMPKREYKIMCRAMGFEPIMINSALVSAQNRKRYYWCGKLRTDGKYVKVRIEQPEDDGIVLRDILEDIPFDAVNAKGEPIWKPVPEKYLEVIAKRIEKFEAQKREGCLALFNTNPSGK